MARTDLRFDVTALDQASKAFARMGQAVERFERRLDRLDGKRVDVDVDVDTTRAEREVGAFARDMQRRITAAVRALPDIDIGADSSDADVEIAAIRKDLADLGDKQVGIDIDAALAQATLENLSDRLADLSRDSADVKVTADTAAAVAALGLVDDRVDRLDGRTARVDVRVGRGLGDAVIRVAALGRAMSVGLPAAVAVATPHLAAAGAAAVSMSQALYLLPAAGFAAAAGIGALVIGMQGFGDALAARGDAAEFAEALEVLSPAARAAAVTIADLGDAWSAMQRNVQENLFATAGQDIARLSNSYLPVLDTALSGIAARIGEAGRAWTDFATSIRTTRDAEQGLSNIEKAAQSLAPIIVNVSEAFRDIGLVGSQFLPGLAQGFDRATGRAAAFFAAARESGQLSVWIQEGIDAVVQFGRVLGNIGSALNSVFSAAEEAGYSFLGTLERITGAVDDFFASAQGQDALVSVFTEIRSAVDAAAPGVRALALAVVDVVQSLSDAGVFTAAAAAFSALAESAAPVVEFLGELAAVVLPPLLAALEGLAPVLGPAIAAMLALVAAGKLAAAVLILPAAALRTWTAFAGLSAGVTGFGAALGGVGKGGREADAGTKGLPAVIGGVGKSAGDADGKVRGLAGRLPGLALVAGAAFVALNQLSELELELPAPDMGAWDGFVAQAESHLKQVGDMFDSIIGGEFDSFSQQWDNYWDGGGSNIVLDLDAQQAWSTAEAFLADINDSEARVVVDGDTMPLGDAVTRVMDAISTGRSTVIIDGETVPVDQALNSLRERINLTQGSIIINGTSVPAGDALFQVLANINAASGTLVINGDETPASGALERIQAAIDGGAGTVSIDGDEIPAQQALGLVEAAINNTAARIVIDGEGRPALEALAQVEALIDSGGGMVDIGGEVMPAETALALIKGRIDATTGRVDVDADTTPGESEVVRFRDGIRQTGADIPVGAQDLVQPELTSILGRINTTSGTVNINGNTVPVGTALAQAISLISQGEGKIRINGDPLPAGDVLRTLQGQIDGSTAAVQIGGNSVPAGTALNAIITAINTGNGTVQINGNRVPVDEVLGAVVAALNSASGTATLNADGRPATAVLDGWLGRTNAARGTSTMNANAGPANSAVDSWRSRTNSTVGTVRATADAGAANAAIDNAARPRTATIRVNYIAGRLPGPVGSLAHGGILTPMADGGVLGRTSTGRPVRRFEQGGLEMLDGHRLRPMAALAAAVPANTWRVVGDNLRHTEVYAPLDGSRRSLGYLRYGARAFGYELVPRAALQQLRAQRMADGGVLDMRSVVRDVVSQPRPAPGRDVLTRTPSRVAGGSTAVLEARISDLTAAVRSARPITVEDRSGNPVETARAAQLALRMAG